MSQLIDNARASVIIYAAYMNNYAYRMNKLIIQNLHKSFQQQTILEGVSFTAKQGEVVALLGSSGSGKSTLLRCINLLTRPDSGSIQVNQEMMHFGPGVPLLSEKQMNGLRQRVGMVFQQFNLWPHMTIMENLIEAPVYVLKQNKQAAMAEASALLVKVGLADKSASFPNQLSGGQQQRVAIARALMMKPEIILFDEPTSALDPETSWEVLQTMQQLAADGMTMIVATHELNFAKRIANQTIFLDRGKLIEQGETHALFTNPRSVKFQRFLEVMQH